MDNPYANLERRAFWRSAVTEREPLDPGDLYRPKFPISREMRIVTAGSCFAQHVGRALKTAGFNVVDGEPFPAEIDEVTAQKFGYGLYSARYGNIYTARQLMQLTDEMRGAFSPADPVWEKDGRYYDAQRPNVEPGGLDSPESVMRHRALHLAQVRRTFLRADLFVFTFGLTEAWVHRETGTVYPTAPGTIAGRHDPEVHAFKNFDYAEILQDFESFMRVMRARNPQMRFLVTTSPVPLTATASGQHVEVATSYSKSVLRAVCGKLYESHDCVDYFPAYEIITSANSRGVYYEANKRTVSRLGVQTAMRLFMQAHDPGAADDAPAPPRPPEPGAVPAGKARARLDDVCEEAMLEAFLK